MISKTGKNIGYWGNVISKTGIDIGYYGNVTSTDHEINIGYLSNVISKTVILRVGYSGNVINPGCHMVGASVVPQLNWKFLLFPECL